MKIKFIPNVILFFACYVIGNTLYAQSALDSIFLELDKAMRHKKQYDLEKNKRIDGLKALLTYDNQSIEANDSYQINSKLIDEYWSYSFDSTVTYINKNISIAKQLQDNEKLYKNKLNLALILA